MFDIANDTSFSLNVLFFPIQFVKKFYNSINRPSLGVRLSIERIKRDFRKNDDWLNIIGNIFRIGVLEYKLHRSNSGNDDLKVSYNCYSKTFHCYRTVLEL